MTGLHDANDHAANAGMPALVIFPIFMWRSALGSASSMVLCLLPARLSTIQMRNNGRAYLGVRYRLQASVLHGNLPGHKFEG